MNDEQIVELYWNRNENAIVETSNKYSRLCRTIAMNILGDLADAEECAFFIPSAEENFEERQIYQYINEFLREQKKETRIIFVRRYWYADSVASIAQRMGYTEEEGCGTNAGNSWYLLRPVYV